ncbi:MAG: hypothetical protein LBK68_02615, partial [Candidatus Margulisbacteria bacterium]|nr:hypothetical protein [Candidatus Margulisiibacteriota bacterium]
MQALFVKIALFLLSGVVFALGLHKEVQKNLSLVYSINATAKQTRQYIQKMLTYILETLTIKFMPP